MSSQVVEPSSSIPDKLYFKIGEVADIVGVKPYVLRYWETEFPEIAPQKSKSRQRLYKRKEVELIVYIRNLLYQDKFTIEGARKKVKEIHRRGRAGAKEEGNSQIALPLNGTFDLQAELKELRKKLLELGKVLENL